MSRAAHLLACCPTVWENIGYDWYSLSRRIRWITSHGQKRRFVGFVGREISVTACGRELPESLRIHWPYDNAKRRQSVFTAYSPVSQAMLMQWISINGIYLLFNAFTDYVPEENTDSWSLRPIHRIDRQSCCNQFPWLASIVYSIHSLALLQQQILISGIHSLYTVSIGHVAAPKSHN